MTSIYFVFTELSTTIKYEGRFLYNLLSPSDVTALHKMKYGGGGVISPCFHRVTSLRFTELRQFYDILIQVLSMYWLVLLLDFKYITYQQLKSKSCIC